jgi:ribonucleoside-diphosphate reductase alpha chain
MAMAPEQMGIGIRRYFTEPGTDPYDTVEWERRDARIPNYKDGTDAFFQPDVEFPVSWSQNASNIVAQKYFRGTLGTPERESSLKQVVDRIADTIAGWGIRDGYFVDDEEAEAFRDELKYVLVHQRAAFNSPVWFNIGVRGVPQQASACQPYHALVSTPEGPVPIGKLVDDAAIGSKVFDAYGLTKILAVKHNGRKDVLRIHARGGVTLDVTGDHLVWCGVDECSGDFVEASSLRAGDNLERHADERVELLEIDRVEPLGEMDVYDIQTESGEYLSNDLRVHNCFILAVEDKMDAILNWYREEGIIFKGGSGSGINLSGLRSSQEGLQGGGTASGPVSFMRGADASAGTIKCLQADTPVATDHGVVPIRLAQPGWSVVTRFGMQPIDEVHDNGVQPLVRVRTALGDEIVCTPEHRFRVRGREGETWREARQLRPDDFALIDVSSQYAGAPQALKPVAEGHHRELRHDFPETLDEHLALWLGWVFGDGSITTGPNAKFVAMQIGDQDAGLVQRYKALTASVFGPGVHFYEGRHGDRADASTSVRFSSGEIIRFLEANGLRKPKTRELSVPSLVHASPGGVRAAFLAGLFEADGHVGNGYPQLSNVSATLARDVHRLLLSIGIPSTIGRIDDRATALGKNPVFVVRVVGGEGVRRFAKAVGFVSERKSRALDAACERKDRSPYEVQWSLPHVQAELDRIWRLTDDQRLRRAIAPYCRFKPPRSMSMLRARALVERFPRELALTPLADFAYGEDLYVPVTVEPAGEGQVMDLTVRDVHQYLVNSVVTHNSGGKTRRAAKMVILNADHPDIEEFIWCKAIEERKARALREAGFDMDLDGKDSHSIQYQNANNSVRVTDEFMQAVLEDRDWQLKPVTAGEPRTVKARELMRQISEATWECADPGMQFDTTINRWHTAPRTGRINASNPCSEYMHLDNSACNLASINLLRYLDDNDEFDVEAFEHTVEVVFTAQEILVGNADYPTDKIAETSRAFRQLGLGYANLGALLMARGLPYDSPEGRAWAGAITSLMTGHAYATSARTAARMGPFAGYADNADAMRNVLRMHREETTKIDDSLVPPDLLGASRRAWDDAVEVAEAHGVRNSQASVLAPTGCLVGGTLVPTERGLVRLGSLGDPAGEQWQPLGIDVGTDEGRRPATQFYVNGAEPVVDVRTSRGYRIRGTAKHRVKVVDESGVWEWRRFADLRPGDRVPLALDQLVGGPQEVRLPPLSEAYWTGEHHARAPRRMTPDLAELVGYFMGDGSLHSRGIRLCVAKDDFDVVERLVQLGKECFGLQAHVIARVGYSEVAFHSVRLTEWWEACGFAKREPADGHSGKGWLPHIPDAVLYSNDREVYAAFLRGLFEADGTVTSGIPHWSTTSLEHSHDVQSLLLALGYPTTRKMDRSGWGDSPLAVLRLLNTSYHTRWLEEIGFISSRKQSAASTSEGRQGARQDHIPLTRALVDRLAPVNDRLRKVLLMEVSRGRVSRRVATELYERTGNGELGRLLGFFYDTVASAELGDEELTYDLSVPTNVTYVANGFVSHNTIGLMMDCDTTGIEPDLALTKAKKLVGGGTMLIVNQTVPRALRRLGYSDEQVDQIVAHVNEHKSIIGAPGLNTEHLPVFACSMGDNTIHYMGHVTMMGAVQPFISGAISKTVNMPEHVSVEDVEQLHTDAWKLGLKAVAVYRDNCKVAQPLATQKKESEKAGDDPLTQEAERVVEHVITVEKPVRRKLPKKRMSKTFSFRVADCHGYVTVGEFEDGRPGEVFLMVAKQGSTLAGIMDGFAIAVSLGLQFGVPLRTFVEKFTNVRFEPAGMTDDREIRFATSLVDYIFRRLAVEYLPADERREIGVLTVDERLEPTLPGVEEASTVSHPGLDTLPVEDQPPTVPQPSEAASTMSSTIEGETVICHTCGDIMQRAGSCYACPSCGTTSGCS